MRNAPGFSMPKEMPRRLLTPLRKVQSEHDALSLSSPAPTVRVPDPASGSDSYLVFNATLVISLSLSLLCAKNAVSQTPFLRSPTTVRKSEESGDAPDKLSLSYQTRSSCVCALPSHTTSPLCRRASFTRPQPVTSPLLVRPQLGDLAPVWDRSFGVSLKARTREHYPTVIF